MIEHKRIKRERQEELEEESRHKRKARQPLHDQLKAQDEGVIDCVDALSTGKHAALLANAHSDGQRANLIAQLQKSYGNAYVQRVMERIQSEKGSGKPLEPETRSEMEIAFKQDFSDVRIHTNATADEVTGELGAKAFTTGKDIFFREGAYQPTSEAGKGLLGHELTHVVQQKGGIQAGNVIGRISDALEEEAAKAGRVVGEGRRVSVETASATPVLQRQEEGEEEEVMATQAAMKPEEVKKRLDDVVDALASGFNRAQILVLWRLAAVCRELGMEAEANDAINKVIEMFTEILESKIGEFDVQSARKEIIKDLLEATADVLAAGGDYEKVEPAMEAALEWAKEQLTDAIKELKEAPAEEKEEKAKQVLTNAGNVILLGGDAEMVWEKVKTVLKWAEECLDDAINKLRTAPTEKKAQEVEKMATLVWKLSGNMAKVDIAIKTIEEWKSEVKQGER